jgi:hypothetical protein
MRRSVAVFIIILCLTTTGSAFAADIHTAAAKGDLVEVEKLIKWEPTQVTLTDKDGATALHHAAAKDQLAVVKFLIEKKADVNAKKKDGVTALHIAAALGYKDITVALLDANANPSVVDKKGRTPLSIAKAKGKTEVEELLRARLAKTPKTSADKLGIPAPPPAPMTDKASSAKDIKTLAEEFIDHIVKGDYSAASNYLSTDMHSLMPAPKMAQTWQTIESQAGKFKGRIATKKDKIKGFDVVLITCLFEKTKLDAQITFDSTNLISGFYMVNPK